MHKRKAACDSLFNLLTLAGSQTVYQLAGHRLHHSSGASRKSCHANAEE